MARYIFMVQSNPVAGQEEAYNDWYENVHVDEVIAVPGFAGAQRFKLVSAVKGDAPSLTYNCLYEIETDDLDGVLAKMWEAAPGMSESPAIDMTTSTIAIYEAAGPRHASPGS